MLKLEKKSNLKVIIFKFVIKLNQDVFDSYNFTSALALQSSPFL